MPAAANAPPLAFFCLHRSGRTTFETDKVEYKKHYSDEEINEVITWFQERMDRLPQSLDMGKGTMLPDLKRTVRLYFDIAELHKDNPTYAAQIHHLFKIRDALLQPGQGNAEEA